MSTRAYDLTLAASAVGLKPDSILETLDGDGPETVAYFFGSEILPDGSHTRHARVSLSGTNGAFGFLVSRGAQQNLLPCKSETLGEIMREAAEWVKDPPSPAPAPAPAPAPMPDTRFVEILRTRTQLQETMCGQMDADVADAIDDLLVEVKRLRALPMLRTCGPCRHWRSGTSFIDEPDTTRCSKTMPSMPIDINAAPPPTCPLRGSGQ